MLQAATGWSVDGGTLTIDSTVPARVQQRHGARGHPHRSGLVPRVRWAARRSIPTWAPAPPSPRTAACRAPAAATSTTRATPLDGDEHQHRAHRWPPGWPASPHVSTMPRRVLRGLEAAAGFVVSGYGPWSSPPTDGSTLEFSTSARADAERGTARPAPRLRRTAGPSAGASAVATGGIVGCVADDRVRWSVAARAACWTSTSPLPMTARSPATAAATTSPAPGR